MFTSARWRLTLWFVSVLAIILAILGLAVYFTARTLLFNQVDDDLRARSAREIRPLATQLLERIRRGEPLTNIQLGPTFTAGGYFYALTNRDGILLATTPNVDPSGLASPEKVAQAIEGGPTFARTESSNGDDLRVYIVPLEGGRGTRLVLEVGRSMEPELQALRRLLLILVGGGGAALLLALGGGYFLAGKALAPIRQAMERQRAFIADASHELRTPLSLIRANAELLRRHPQKKVQDNITLLDDVIEESDRLGSLLSQLLTLAQADAGQTPLTLGPVDLQQVVKEVAQQTQPLAQSKSLQLHLETNGPVFVTGDQLQLQELLLILLDNAIKFTDPGGSIQLELTNASGRARLTVADTGRGIPEESLRRVFDRFYRADKARSSDKGGAGLGLAIAKAIVDSHRGSVQVESHLGQGTTFTVELPTQQQP